MARLQWNKGKGDSDDDQVFEAQDADGTIWQLSIHDQGPSWNWFQLDDAGEVIDVGFAPSPEIAKEAIEACRAHKRAARSAL